MLGRLTFKHAGCLQQLCSASTIPAADAFTSFSTDGMTYAFRSSYRCLHDGDKLVPCVAAARSMRGSSASCSYPTTHQNNQALYGASLGTVGAQGWSLLSGGLQCPPAWPPVHGLQSNPWMTQQQRGTHKVPYSIRSGTPRPAPWPVFEPIKRSKAGTIKWHRTLYRFPEEVDVQLQDRTLTLSGRAGTVSLDMATLDPSGLVAFSMMQFPTATPSEAVAASGQEKATGQVPRSRPVLALAAPDKDRFASFVAELDASIRGVTVGYLVGVTVKGVGYRIEPMEEAPRKRTWYFEDDKADRSAAVYPHPTPVPAVRLKVGYSRTAVFPLPDGIRAFCIKPTLLYLYGLRKEEVDAAAMAVRSVRRPNVYTGNGVQLLDEVVRIKQRKASK